MIQNRLSSGMVNATQRYLRINNRIKISQKNKEVHKMQDAHWGQNIIWVKKAVLPFCTQQHQINQPSLRHHLSPSKLHWNNCYIEESLSDCYFQRHQSCGEEIYSSLQMSSLTVWRVQVLNRKNNITSRDNQSNQRFFKKLRYFFFSHTSIRKKVHTRPGVEFLKCGHQADILLIHFKWVLLT